ncbi:hypothetical protein V8G54_014652 [Vigna mungo]|uniref:Uncharacterized protein n=1 Tax=Vigna mungo TaxID=3915 RepID=A0AAQ3NI32_VIGMU
MAQDRRSLPPVGCSSRTENTAQSGSAAAVWGSFRCWEEGNSRFLRRWMLVEVVRSRCTERVEVGSNSRNLRHRPQRKEETAVEGSLWWKEVAVKGAAAGELGCRGFDKRNTWCIGSAHVRWL